MPGPTIMLTVIKPRLPVTVEAIYRCEQTISEPYSKCILEGRRGGFSAASHVSDAADDEEENSRLTQPVFAGLRSVSRHVADFVAFPSFFAFWLPSSTPVKSFSLLPLASLVLFPCLYMSACLYLLHIFPRFAHCTLFRLASQLSILDLFLVTLAPGTLSLFSTCFSHTHSLAHLLYVCLFTAPAAALDQSTASCSTASK